MYVVKCSNFCFNSVYSNHDFLIFDRSFADFNLVLSCCKLSMIDVFFIYNVCNKCSSLFFYIFPTILLQPSSSSNVLLTLLSGCIDLNVFL